MRNYNIVSEGCLGWGRNRLTICFSFLLATLSALTNLVCVQGERERFEQPLSASEKHSSSALLPFKDSMGNWQGNPSQMWRGGGHERPWEYVRSVLSAVCIVLDDKPRCPGRWVPM